MNYSEAANLKLKGRRYIESGQNVKAVETFHISLGLNPDDAEAHNWLGIALENTRLYDQAIISYGKAIDLDPLYDKAIYNRGMAYKEIKNFSAAIEDFTKVVNMNTPASKKAFLQRKWTYEELPFEIHESKSTTETLVSISHSKNTLSELNEIVNQSPLEAEPYYYRGIEAAKQKDHEQATNDFSRAIELGLKRENVFYNRAKAYLSSYYQAPQPDNLIKAKCDFEEALKFPGLGSTEREDIRRYRQFIEEKLLP